MPCSHASCEIPPDMLHKLHPMSRSITEGLLAPVHRHYHAFSVWLLLLLSLALVSLVSSLRISHISADWKTQPCHNDYKELPSSSQITRLSSRQICSPFPLSIKAHLSAVISKDVFFQSTYLCFLPDTQFPLL